MIDKDLIWLVSGICIVIAALLYLFVGEKRKRKK